MKKLWLFFFCVFLPFVAAAVGTFFTEPQIDTWYETLIRPSFNPPNWIFGPVWTALYFMMGVALYLVWQRGKGFWKNLGILIFLIHLVANSVWSVFFFGYHQISWALADIVILWGMILGLIFIFKKVDKTAAYLLVPYFLWVSFASILNYSIWVLN